MERALYIVEIVECVAGFYSLLKSFTGKSSKSAYAYIKLYFEVKNKVGGWAVVCVVLL